MELPQHEAYGLFPTLVQVFDLTDNEQMPIVLKTVENTKTYDHLIMHNSESTYDESHGNAWLDQAVLSKFKDTLSYCVNVYSQTYGLPELRITNSWMNRVGIGGAVKQHRHEMSAISGAFYPIADEGSCGLIFKSPLLPLKMHEFNVNETLYNAYNQTMPCKQGTLVLFPSWLEHYTEENTTENRVTVSFNTGYAS